MTEEVVRWRCTECGDEVESDPTERHSMDYCGCGEAFVDAEQEYMRSNFNVEFWNEETEQYESPDWP